MCESKPIVTTKELGRECLSDRQERPCDSNHKRFVGSRHPAKWACEGTCEARKKVGRWSIGLNLKVGHQARWELVVAVAVTELTMLSSAPCHNLTRFWALGVCMYSYPEGSNWRFYFLKIIFVEFDYCWHFTQKNSTPYEPTCCGSCVKASTLHLLHLAPEAWISGY